MNSKELLDQAREAMRKQTELIDMIEGAEKLIEDLGHFELYLYTNGSYINKLIKPEAIQKMKDITTKSISEYLVERQLELEKLLGIRKPEMIINAEFEKAVLEMDEQQTEKTLVVETKNAKCVVVQKDPIEEKLKTVLKDEAKRIEAVPEEKSLDKFPAKAKKYSGYPEGMTEELVREMYIDKQMKIGEIADHFKVTYSKANNFISKHKLHRTTQAPKAESQPEKQPGDKECHSQP